MSTVRPLRQDAARNRERLVAAAREVFRRRGLDAPLEEIARTAGVAIGTLYNRFADRGELVDAALGPLAQRAVELAEQAARAEDPWQGFATLLEDTCELFATDHGYADMYRSSVPGTPVIAAAKKRLGALKRTIMTRAQRQASCVMTSCPPISRSSPGAWSAPWTPPETAPRTPGAVTWDWCSTACAPGRRTRCPSRP